MENHAKMNYAHNSKKTAAYLVEPHSLGYTLKKWNSSTYKRDLVRIYPPDEKSNAIAKAKELNGAKTRYLGKNGVSI